MDMTHARPAWSLGMKWQLQASFGYAGMKNGKEKK
jgi:hypothetical protein